VVARAHQPQQPPVPRVEGEVEVGHRRRVFPVLRTVTVDGGTNRFRGDLDRNKIGTYAARGAIQTMDSCVTGHVLQGIVTQGRQR